MTPRRVDTMSSGRARAATGIRIVAGGVAAGAVIALFSGVGAATTANAEAPSPHKSYVCKYVSKPGEAERLQTGQNPIWVDNHSLLGYDGETFVGQEFKDGQFRSVVIVANTKRLTPEPSVAACRQAPPTTSATTTSTTTTPPTTKPPTTSTPPPTASTSSPTTTTPGPVPTSTYPLQPVQGGATQDVGITNPITPWQALLALVALAALWVALGASLARVSRPGSPGGRA